MNACRLGSDLRPVFPPAVACDAHKQFYAHCAILCSAPQSGSLGSTLPVSDRAPTRQDQPPLPPVASKSTRDGGPGRHRDRGHLSPLKVVAGQTLPFVIAVQRAAKERMAARSRASEPRRLSSTSVGLSQQVGEGCNDGTVWAVPGINYDAAFWQCGERAPMVDGADARNMEPFEIGPNGQIGCCSQ